MVEYGKRSICCKHQAGRSSGSSIVLSTVRSLVAPAKKVKIIVHVCYTQYCHGALIKIDSIFKTCCMFLLQTAGVMGLPSNRAGGGGGGGGTTLNYNGYIIMEVCTHSWMP